MAASCSACIGSAAPKSSTLRHASCCIRRWSALIAIARAVGAFRRFGAKVRRSPTCWTPAPTCCCAPTAAYISDRIALTEFARAHGLPRIAWAHGNDEPEPIAILRPPTTSLSGITITPPPGAFLQASASGEAAIIAAVLAALPAQGRIAELFAGCGSSPSPWRSERASRHGKAMRRPHPRCASLPITPVCRPDRGDTARPGAPAAAGEGTGGFAAVVLDPPLAGAAAQVAQIAAAKTPVGCLRELQSRDVGARRHGCCPGRFSLLVSYADRSVPLVGAAGKRMRFPEYCFGRHLADVALAVLARPSSRPASAFRNVRPVAGRAVRCRVC